MSSAIPKKSTWIFAVGFSRDNVGKGRCSKEPSSAQTALRWGLQMGHIVLPKSTNEGRIRENFEVLGWSITEEMFGKFSEIQRSHIWCKLLIFEQLIIIFCTVQARLVQASYPTRNGCFKCSTRKLRPQMVKPPPHTLSAIIGLEIWRAVI